MKADRSRKQPTARQSPSGRPRGLVETFLHRCEPFNDQRVDLVDGIEELGHGRVGGAHPIRRVCESHILDRSTGTGDRTLRQRDSLGAAPRADARTAVSSTRRARRRASLDPRARTVRAESRIDVICPKASHSCASDSSITTHRCAVTPVGGKRRTCTSPGWLSSSTRVADIAATSLVREASSRSIASVLSSVMVSPQTVPSAGRATVRGFAAGPRRGAPTFRRRASGRGHR